MLKTIVGIALEACMSLFYLIRKYVIGFIPCFWGKDNLREVESRLNAHINLSNSNNKPAGFNWLAFLFLKKKS